ncbi:MAG: hypothetical protein A4E57_04555 [Syntrophorhabdaceae bacterium PtaU1.Bin034]|nr:MAG: hypothetical protein A4E57_04555 [Syntrophorhabdaceae bacterium PtaU1.Bin034]
MMKRTFASPIAIPGRTAYGSRDGWDRAKSLPNPTIPSNVARMRKMRLLRLDGVISAMGCNPDAR